MRKQLVCCQLGAEFTLLVGKFAAGTDEENWLSARQASLSTLCTYLLWQKKKNFENTMHNEMHARVGGGRQEAVGKLAKRRRRWSEKYGTCLRSLKRLVCVVLMFFFFPSPFFFVSINLECLSHRWHFHCVQNKLYISLSSLKSRWRRKVCLGVAPETFGVFEVRATTAAQRERFANNNTAEAESLSGWMEMKTLLTLLYNRATWYSSFQIHGTFSLFCARSLRWAGSWPARLFKMLIWNCQKNCCLFKMTIAINSA